MSRIVDDLRWARSGGTRIVEPPTAKKDQGWTPGKPPAAEYMNWWLERAGRRILGQHPFLAGETIAAGDWVYLSDDGKVKKPLSARSALFSKTTGLSQQSDNSDFTHAAVKIDRRRVLIAYENGSGFPECAILTIDANVVAQAGTTAAATTALPVASGGIALSIVNSTKALLLFTNASNGIVAAHVTYSGDNISSIGTEITAGFTAHIGTTDNPFSNALLMSSDSVLVAYEFAVTSQVGFVVIDVSGANPAHVADGETATGTNSDGGALIKLSTNLAAFQGHGLNCFVKFDPNVSVEPMSDNSLNNAGSSQRAGALVLMENGWILGAYRPTQAASDSVISLTRTRFFNPIMTFGTETLVHKSTLMAYLNLTTKGRMSMVDGGANMILITECAATTLDIVMDSVADALWTTDRTDDLDSDDNRPSSDYTALQLHSLGGGVLLNPIIVPLEGGQHLVVWWDRTSTDLHARTFWGGDFMRKVYGVAVEGGVLDDEILVASKGGVVDGLSGLTPGALAYPNSLVSGLSTDIFPASAHAAPDHLWSMRQPVGVALEADTVRLYGDYLGGAD